MKNRIKKLLSPLVSGKKMTQEAEARVTIDAILNDVKDLLLIEDKLMLVIKEEHELRLLQAKRMEERLLERIARLSKVFDKDKAKKVEESIEKMAMLEELVNTMPESYNRYIKQISARLSSMEDRINILEKSHGSVKEAPRSVRAYKD